MSRMSPSGLPTPTSTRPWTRLIWILVPAIAFLVVLALATANRGGAPEPGDDAPDFSGPLLDGSGTLELNDLAARPVVLNFWASWCGPCEEEAPMLQRAFEEYGDRIAFVGVDIRDARSDALEFVDEHDLEYPNVRDEGQEILTDYGLTGQPETFFIDQDGKIVEHVPGALTEVRLFELLDVLVRRDV